MDTVQAMPVYQSPPPTPLAIATPPAVAALPTQPVEPPPANKSVVAVPPPPVAANFETARTAPVQTGMIGATAAPSRPQMPSVEAPAYPPPVSAAAPFPIPPAPYTPPPLRDATKSLAPYSFPSNHFLDQRVSAYRQGGYEMVNYTPFQVTMAQGKGLGFFWWLVAMLSGVGLLWYLIIMLTSGFSKDRVYLIVERDGALYEDGAGAAHVRRHRARVGRRWGFLGVVIFFLSLLWFAAMMGVGVYGVENYRPELEASYPEVTLFSSDDVPPNPESLDADRVATAESGVVAFSVLFIICLLSLLTGLTLTIVGYLHSTAYDVQVLPLPVYK